MLLVVEFVVVYSWWSVSGRLPIVVWWSTYDHLLVIICW